MIVMKLRGDFGSQLFAYATGYSLAKDNKTNLRIEISQYSREDITNDTIDKMNLDYKNYIICKYSNKVIQYIVRSFYMKQPYLCYTEQRSNSAYDYRAIKKAKSILLPVYYSGYWQSYKYFDHRRNELIKQFTPRLQVSDSIKMLINRVITYEDSVAVHVRRKDAQGMNPRVPLSYYTKALEYMKDKFSTAKFFFFSDDITWCRQNFGDINEFCFMNEEIKLNELEELYIMSYCHHQIISDSASSWWAAYLNMNKKKEVIAPQFEYCLGDYYPEKWIKISIND